MRLSKNFGNTLRESPVGADTPGHELLLRAGFIRQLGQGLFSSLPLGWRTIRKIEAILREEMERIGAQELSMPVVHPADAWKATGRYSTVGPELVRFKDRRGRPMVLAMTHEEVVTLLARSEIRSYRQLPQLVYQIQTKFRDDPRPRAGLIRVREFVMMDSYSFDRDEEGLDKQYAAHHQAYQRIFDRCSVPVIAVGSDVGMMGGLGAHEFMYLSPVGEDTLVICPRCDYAANRQVATFHKEPFSHEDPLPLEEVATPGVTSIADLAGYMGVDTARTAKVVLLAAETENGEESQTVVAVVRGDMDVNETKLANLVGAISLRPLTEEEIVKAGMVPGYASPIAITKDVTVVVDDLIPSETNLIAGANRSGYHYLNVNYGRDYAARVTADIVSAREGSPCTKCGAALTTSRGVEVGNIFKLGTRYSEAIGATYLDEKGIERPVVMGSYGVGLGRLLACIAEESRDEQGLVWPEAVAPFRAHLVALGGEGSPAQDEAERLYALMVQTGIEVLYDDRDESAGEKFADADLIGLPTRITVSKRSLQSGGAELKARDADAATVVPVEEVSNLVGSLRTPTAES